MYISVKVKCPFCFKDMTFNASHAQQTKECWKCNAIFTMTGFRPSGASFTVEKVGQIRRANSTEVLQYEV